MGYKIVIVKPDDLTKYIMEKFGGTEAWGIEEVFNDVWAELQNDKIKVDLVEIGRALESLRYRGDLYDAFIYCGRHGKFELGVKWKFKKASVPNVISFPSVA